MADDKQINFLKAMAERIRAAGSDQVKVDALVAAIENEARILREGPDPEPLTEDEKSFLFDPITGDRKRVFQAGEIKQDRARAAEMRQQHDKAAEVSRKRREGLTAPDAADGPRPEPFRIGGPAREDEIRTERGREDDRRAATAAGLAGTTPKLGSGNPIVNPPPPVSPGNRPVPHDQADADAARRADNARRDANANPPPAPGQHAVSPPPGILPQVDHSHDQDRRPSGSPPTDQYVPPTSHNP